ncbi:MAG: hypothetical protein RSB37_05985 [Acetivibrio sp.]
MDNKKDLIGQLAQEMKMGEKEVKKEEDQYISATGTLEADPEKSLEKLKPVEKKDENPWDKLKLNPVNFR